MRFASNAARIGAVLFWILALIVMTALFVSNYAALPTRSTTTLLQWSLLLFWTLVLPLVWAIRLRARSRAAAAAPGDAVLALQHELNKAAAGYLALGYGAALLALSVVRVSLR